MADFAMVVNNSYSPYICRRTSVWTPQLTTVMISAMNFGPRLNLYSLTATASVVALPETTGAFSMPSCGSFAQEHLGVIFLHWNSVFVRFRRLAKAGFWTRQATMFTDCPDFEWIMINASHIKVHQHGMGAPGGTEDEGGPKEV